MNKRSKSMDTPPIIAPVKSMRFAVTLNLMLPGAGQFYLGQRAFGIALALTFLICFGTMLGIFLVGYGHYLTVITGGDILQSGELEHLSAAFHTGWLIGLLIAAILIYFVSLLALRSARPRG